MGKTVYHNEDAEWLKCLEGDLKDVEQQNNVTIAIEMVQKQLGKISNWKSPGSDGLQGFWLKKFTAVSKRLVQQRDDCLQQNSIPEWMTKGRTVLIIKDKELGTLVTNFRPITCLPLLWKLLTGIIAEETYQHRELKDLLPEEQKGAARALEERKISY